METGTQVVLSAFVAALVAGLFLLGGYYYNRRLERLRAAERSWQQVGMPVINAADDLVARLFDVIVRRRRLRLDERIESTPAEIFDPSKELSTVWRLMFFLASATYLEQHVADERADSKIANLRFYANNKARIPLKGNLFGASYRLQTEGQQLIGSKVVSLANTREIRDVDFFLFVQSLSSDEELWKSADAVRKLLNFEMPERELDGQFLCVAQFTIYLIDLVQDLRPSSKWEEFRVYLASILRNHAQKESGRAAFLYRRNDLKGDDYRDTFNVIPAFDARRFRVRRSPAACRNRRLNKRAKTGFPRQLTADGVIREMGGQRVVIKWSDSPGDVRKNLDSIFG